MGKYSPDPEGDERAIKAAVETREKLRDQMLRDYYSAFKVSEAGQRVYVDLEKCLDRLTYIPGREALEMAFNEGRRSVLLDLRAAVLKGEILVHGRDDDRERPAKVEIGSVFDGTENWISGSSGQ